MKIRRAAAVMCAAFMLTFASVVPASANQTVSISDDVTLSLGTTLIPGRSASTTYTVRNDVGAAISARPEVSLERGLATRASSFNIRVTDVATGEQFYPAPSGGPAPEYDLAAGESRDVRVSVTLRSSAGNNTKNLQGGVNLSWEEIQAGVDRSFDGIRRENGRNYALEDTQVTERITVTNPHSEQLTVTIPTPTITGVQITDQIAGGTVPPGQSRTFTGTYQVTGDVGSQLRIDTRMSGVYANGVEANFPGRTTDYNPGAMVATIADEPSLSVDNTPTVRVVAGPDGGVFVGAEVEVTNTSTVLPTREVSVAGSNFLTGNGRTPQGTSVEISPDSSATFIFDQRQLTEDDLEEFLSESGLHLTATATGSSLFHQRPEDPALIGTDHAYVTSDEHGLNVDQVIASSVNVLDDSGDGIAQEGEDLSYVFNIVSNAQVPLHGLQLADAEGNPVPGTFELEPGFDNGTPPSTQELDLGEKFDIIAGDGVLSPGEVVRASFKAAGPHGADQPEITRDFQVLADLPGFSGAGMVTSQKMTSSIPTAEFKGLHLRAKMHDADGDGFAETNPQGGDGPEEVTVTFELRNNTDEQFTQVDINQALGDIIATPKPWALSAGDGFDGTIDPGGTVTFTSAPVAVDETDLDNGLIEARAYVTAQGATSGAVATNTAVASMPVVQNVIIEAGYAGASANDLLGNVLIGAGLVVALLIAASAIAQAVRRRRGDEEDDPFLSAAPRQSAW